MGSTTWRRWGAGVLVVTALSCTPTDERSDAGVTGPTVTVPGGPDGVERHEATTSTVEHESSTTATTTATATTTTTAMPLPPDRDGDGIPDALPTPRLGEVIGSGSIGPAIIAPLPWPIGTIYSDLEPGVLIVDFTPSDVECLAARAEASIGRGGAILVGLWVDGEPGDGPCPASDGVGGIRIELTEEIGERRIYTSTVAETDGASARAELVADSIIGLREADAIAVVRGEGLAVRDNTDASDVESDLRFDRINIWLVDGAVEFAAVF